MKYRSVDREKLVSVIVPAYNAQNTIAQTIDSILNQTYENLEVIVVDDGSQDRTVELVMTIASKDTRITLLRQSNAGVAKARNLAINNSHGEFIAPIDADDLWHPDKIAKQVDKIANSSISVGLVYCWSIGIDLEDRVLRNFSENHLKYFNTAEGKVFRALIYRNFIGNASSALIRRSCLEKVGLYNYHLHQQNAQGCEDWDLYLRIAEHYEFRVVPEFLVGYRQQSNSMSRNFTTMEKSHKLVLSDLKERHPEILPWIYRLSCSNFNYYLASKAAKNKNISLAIFYLLYVLRFDIFAYLSIKSYKIIWKILVHSSIGDFAINNNKTLKADYNKQMPVKFPNGIGTIKPFVSKDLIYNLILKYRWRKLNSN